MSNDVLVLFFLSLGLLPCAITVVFVIKRKNLLKNSIYMVGFSILLVILASGLAQLFGNCDFFEAITMRKRCGTVLLPPKSISSFYLLTIFGVMIIILSLVKKLFPK